jgi:hypothetical protein
MELGLSEDVIRTADTSAVRELIRFLFQTERNPFNRDGWFQLIDIDSKLSSGMTSVVRWHIRGHLHFHPSDEKAIDLALGLLEKYEGP